MDDSLQVCHPGERRTGLLALALAKVLSFYRFFSRYLPATCRFYPSCSEYAVEALRKHGAMKGTALSLTRLLRCHPFSEGGYDPVP